LFSEHSKTDSQKALVPEELLVPWQQMSDGADANGFV
jgi:hypothetical protein